LGLVWLTPVVTADRAVLIAVWTTYVFVGSYLKDRRLAQVLGEPYVRYVSEVPAYPFLAWMPNPLRLLDLAAADRTTREEGSNAKTPAKAA
jgi:hypothetical protein